MGVKRRPVGSDSLLNIKSTAMPRGFVQRLALTKAQMCKKFLHRVCCHASGFSVYVPPFATMTHANHTGLWCADLPEHCHTHWDFYDQVLNQALVGSAGNLLETESVRHLLAEFSGYQIHWEMASIAGHPCPIPVH